MSQEVKMAATPAFNLAEAVQALPCVVPNHDGVPYTFGSAYEQGHQEARDQVSQMLRTRAAELRDQLEHLMLSFAAQSANYTEEYRTIHRDGQGSPQALERHSRLADKAMARMLQLFGLPAEESADA